MMVAGGALVHYFHFFELRILAHFSLVLGLPLWGPLVPQLATMQ